MSHCNIHQNSPSCRLNSYSNNEYIDSNTSNHFHAKSSEQNSMHGVQKSVNSIANNLSDFLYPFINPYDPFNIQRFYTPDFDYHKPDFVNSNDHLFTESLLNLMLQGLAGGNIYDLMKQGLAGGNLYDQIEQGLSGGNLYQQMATGFSGGNLNDQMLQGLLGGSSLDKEKKD